MPPSWRPPLGASIAGVLALGVAIVAWTYVPAAWSPTERTTGRTSSDDEDDAVYLVYPTGDEDVTKRYRQRAQNWAAFWDRGADVRVRADTTLTRDSLRHRTAIIAGTPSSPLVSDLLADRPLIVHDGGAFSIGGHTYDDPTDVVFLRIGSADASPLEETIHLAVGSTSATLLPYAFVAPFVLPGLPADYKILRDGRLVAYGTMDDTPARTAEVCTVPDAAPRHVDLRAGAIPRMETEHFRFFAHGVTDRALRAFAESRSSALRSLRSQGRVELPAEKMDYHLFPEHADVQAFRAFVPPVDSDIRTWLRSSWRQRQSTAAQGVRVDSASGDLAVVLHDDPDPIAPAEALRWMRSTHASSSSTPWRDLLGVGRVANAQGSWHGRRIEAWTARLHAAGAVPSLRALADDTTLVHASPLARVPVAGTLVSFLRTRDALDPGARHAPSTDALRRLEPAWEQYLDALAAAQAPSAPSESTLPPALYGANVAFPSGPAWASRGYASRLGEAALSALQAHRATAASIVPYTDMPAPDAPSRLLRRRHRQSSQSDATVVHAIRTAHELGLNVMLKPQIGGEVEWPGAIDMSSDEAWQTFFDRYADWMLHYALMAEIHGVEVLCVGTELVEATRRDAEWRRLIERVRAVYDGAVVYAANWGDEAERLSFGDALDAVGVDSYYPLSSDPDATDAELRTGADAVAQRLQAIAERTGRPLLLTEMGFPSRPAAWTHPHRKREDDPEHPGDQARATRALTAALSDVPLRGAFWWRWPPICRFGYGSFPPKAPTRAVLKDWFERAAGSES